MNLREALIALGFDPEDHHLLKTQLSSIAIDSRRVEESGVFFALKGETQDGRAYIDEALAKGAALIVEESKERAFSFVNNSCLVKAPRSALTPLIKCSLAFDLDELLSIAITGTNGKTTVAWLLSEALRTLGEQVLQTGTCGFKQQQTLSPSLTTTPSIVELAEFLNPQPSALITEMSSHALLQERLSGIAWNAAIFTNLSRDHLDYHGSFEEYREAKKLLFSRELVHSVKKPKFAVINVDDPVAESMLNSSQADIFPVRFSVSSQNADCFLSEHSSTLAGIQAKASVFGELVELRSPLMGSYNASNLLAALSCLAALGFPAPEAAAALSNAQGPPGRLEKITNAGITAVVDYAHTPDALARVTSTLMGLTPGRLIVVFGCGGDRDRGKRSQMAEAVHSNFSIVTSDNPRGENPKHIIEDILPGMSGEYEVVIDRRVAIEQAINMAKDGDVVLVAGKGHEDYQEIAGVRQKFSDKEVCERALGLKIGTE